MEARERFSTMLRSALFSGLVNCIVLFLADVIATALLGLWKGRILLALAIWNWPTNALLLLPFLVSVYPRFYDYGGLNLAQALVRFLANVYQRAALYIWTQGANDDSAILIFLETVSILISGGGPWAVSRAYTVFRSFLRYRWQAAAILTILCGLPCAVYLVSMYQPSQMLKRQVLRAREAAAYWWASQSTLDCATGQPKPQRRTAMGGWPENTHYTYQRLPAGSIRILILLPPAVRPKRAENNPDEVWCEMEHVDLSKDLGEEDAYDALSYFWGEPATQPRRQIFLEGVPVDVTHNLYAALVRLRSDGGPVRLWVDAVCINQTDGAEKAVQIPMMGDIYSRSNEVAIWLGDDEPQDAGGLDFAVFLERAAHKDRTSIEKKGVWAFPNVQAPDPDDGRWGRFFAVFKRPWFGRLWIIQEVALAREPVVYCGRSSSIRWEGLLKALQYAGVLGIQPFYNSHINLNHVQDLQVCRKQYQAGKPSSLAKLLVRTRGASATQPHDKVYGLFGLADPDKLARLRIAINYKMDVADLYRTVAIRTLETSKSLDILQGTRSGRGTCVNLPTWVPDWTQTDPVVTLRHLELGFPDDDVPDWQSQHCQATGNSEASPSFTPDGRVLGLRGHPIGVVEEVSCTVRHGALGSVGAYDFQRALRDWERVARARSGSAYHTGEAILDCYWQTLCAGVMPGNYEICQEEFRRYDHVIRTIRSFTESLDIVPYFASTSLLKATAMIMGMTYHQLFRSHRVIEDLAGFQGNNGAMAGRRMGRSDTGYICLVPEETAVGDSIVLLEGGRVPLIIRPENSEPHPTGITNTWQIVGEAYVHGVMDGSAFKPGKCRKIWFI